MPAPTLPLVTKLTNESSKSTKNRIIKAQYGNGYTQTVRDGLNSDIDSWILVWMPLTGSDLASLRSFITTVGVTTWFTWTPFGESTSKKWAIVQDSIKEKLFNYDSIQISFTIEQRFDLGT